MAAYDFSPLLSFDRRLRPRVQPPRCARRPGGRKPTLRTTSASTNLCRILDRGGRLCRWRHGRWSKETDLIIEPGPESEEKGRESCTAALPSTPLNCASQLADYVEVAGANLENGLLPSGTEARDSGEQEGSPDPDLVPPAPRPSRTSQTQDRPRHELS